MVRSFEASSRAFEVGSRGFKQTLQSILTDSFENYNTGSAPPNWTVQNGTVEAVDASDGSQSFENSYSTSANGESYISSTDPSGEAPSSITYAYWESSASAGQGYVVENTNGNPILKLATTNPAAVVEHSGGTTTLSSSPSPSYEAFRRFTVTFDWANGQFDVTWEDIGGSTANQSASNLGFINSASGIHKAWVGQVSLSSGGTGPDGAEKNDELWGVSSIS